VAWFNRKQTRNNISMKENKKEPVNKEAFKMLASEIGLNEACRRLQVPIPTAKSWKKRYGWKLPGRKTGRPERALPASGSSSLHPIADALDASHKELEDATRTGFAQIVYKAVKAAAEKEALDITNPAQLQAACLAAARLYGWKGDSQVNVAVNNQVSIGVVCTEEQRLRLIALREKLQAEATSKTALSQPETQLHANHEAEKAIIEPEHKPPQPELYSYLREMQSIGNAESWKHGKGSEPTFSTPAGAKAPSDASPVLRAWLEHEGPEPETCA
jgi:hypothetical protein